MKVIITTLQKTVFFTYLIMASYAATAQSDNNLKIQQTKPGVSATTIDTLSVALYFSNNKLQANVNKNALIRGYRKTLRRQKDLYLIPWELRKKHLRIC